MQYTFCTLFDRNYLYRGLALHQSLRIHCRAFTLWVLCMDEITYSTLEKLQLENVRLIALQDFEDEPLRLAKRGRTAAEYCWTCASSLVAYVMQQEPEEDLVAYLDADLFFYADPYPVYEELGQNSILIVEHRYSQEYAGWEATSGIYNVSLVIFRNDPNGRECLGRWIEQCLEACTLDPEAGLCGDQKYLDDWPTRFEGVAVLQHQGAGLAPWNIRNYQLHRMQGKIYVDSDELIFYHFHALQITNRHLLSWRPFLASRGYNFTPQQLAVIYRPYVRQLRRSMEQVRRTDPAFDWGYSAMRWRDMLRALRKGNLILA